MTRCNTLTEVRDHIDRIDDRIVDLLAERSIYVREAARFKPDKHAIVVPERVEEIILRVRHLAAEYGTDPDLVERIYRAMLDAFVLYEAARWQDMQSPG